MKIKRWALVLSALFVSLGLIGVAAIVIILPLFVSAVAQAAVSDPTICSAPAGKISKSVPEPLNSISTSVGEEFDIPGYAVATVYWSENGWHYREPAPPYGKGNPWPVSPAGAMGPFQFLKGTYYAFRFSNPAHKPGNIMDLTDAAYAAGAYLRQYGKLRKDSPIGDPNNPKRGTLMWALGAYNAGPAGNFSNPETSRYLRRAAVEAKRLLNSPATSSTETNSELIDLCKELSELGSSQSTTGSDPGSNPTFGPAPKGSCPKGKLDWPVIRTIGIANPHGGRKVLLCKVGGVTVNAKIAEKWQWLIAKAKSDGVTLSGGGFRTYNQQIALRRAHCGTSHYAIYEMRASACNPDTARPGTSNHETGLAVDLNNARSYNSRVHLWMKANARKVGLACRVPGEPWHWSPTGG